MMVKKTCRKRLTAFNSTASRNSLRIALLVSYAGMEGFLDLIVPCFARHHGSMLSTLAGAV